MKILITAFLVLACSICLAQKSSNDISAAEKYWAMALGNIAWCQATFSLANARAAGGADPGPDGDYRTCIDSGKKSSKADLAAALKSTKKPKAQEALKTFHVAFIGAIEGIVPGPVEKKTNYEQRQQSLSGKLTEAWARFEVEQ